MAAILCNFVVVIVMVRACPQAIPLTMITMKKAIHWTFPMSVVLQAQTPLPITK